MKLLIIDDASVVYRRLIELLGGVENLTALAVARSLSDALFKCRGLMPDAIVLDVDLPDASGLSTIKTVLAQCPSTRVFVFSNHLEYRSRAVEMGVEAFYDKSMEFEVLLARLLGDIAGKRHLNLGEKHA